MLFTDIKYVELVAPKLRNFKKKNTYLWNFSCPICKDSKRNILKARGFIYKIKNNLNFKCHNCGASMGFSNFLKFVDSRLENEYNIEKYKSNSKVGFFKEPIKDFFDQFDKPKQEDKRTDKREIISGLPNAECATSFQSEHPVQKYLSKRKIPTEYFASLYWVNTFKKWVNENIAPKFASTEEDHPRLVIPFYDKKKNLLAIQGRTLGKELPKYYTIKTNEKNEKIFGLDKLDESKTIYAVEGPIDSMFLPNAVAVAGTSFDSKRLLKNKERVIVIIDNEPRNVEVCKSIYKCMKLGYGVCLFPSNISGKDINEIVLKQPKLNIVNLINENTYRGLEAELAFNKWIRCKI
jgi:transcription elongation factor Elf1